MTILDSIMDAANFTNELSISLATFGFSLTSAILSGLAWALLVAGVYLLVSAIIYSQALRSFNSYYNGVGHILVLVLFS